MCPVHEVAFTIACNLGTKTNILHLNQMLSIQQPPRRPSRPSVIHHNYKTSIIQPKSCFIQIPLEYIHASHDSHQYVTNRLEASSKMSEPSVSVSPPAASDLELRKTEAIRKLAAHLPDHDDADFIRFKKLAIVEKLLASFEDPNMSPFFLGEIESFHSHPPLRPVPAFLDDVNQRLQLLRDMKSTKLKREEDSSLPWQCLPATLITANVWAAFIAAPIEALQALLRRMNNGEMLYEHMREGLKSIESNLHTIIQISRQKHPP